jgi:hypothetical protein
MNTRVLGPGTTVIVATAEVRPVDANVIVRDPAVFSVTAKS